LAKLVDAEEMKRGEGVTTTTAEAPALSSSLLDTLDQLDEQNEVATAPTVVAAAAVAATPKAVVLASQLPGASQLQTPQLRKPGTGTTGGGHTNNNSNNINNLLKKKKPKKTSGVVALRMGGAGPKTTMTSTTTNGESLDSFEAAIMPEPAPSPLLTDPAQLLSNASSFSNLSINSSPPISPATLQGAAKNTMAENIAKMKADNMDFFGGL
jgi:hypothetical protein